MQSLLFSVLALGTVVQASPYPVAAPQLQSRAAAPEGAPVVNLKNGSYYGVHNSNYSQDFFLGIPFAQPPIGVLRFANPATYNASWNGALPATDYAFVSKLCYDRSFGMRHADQRAGMHRLRRRSNRVSAGHSSRSGKYRFAKLT